MAGNIPVCAHANATVGRENLSGSPQFERAMRALPDELWFTDAVWANPWSGGRQVLVYVAPIRHEGDVVGVTYLEYDWQGQAAQILASGLSGTGGTTIFSIVDPHNRIVATTGTYEFEARMDIRPRQEKASVEHRGGTVVAQAAPQPYHGFNGLGLRCVIEHRLADTAQIAEALQAAATG